MTRHNIQRLPNILLQLPHIYPLGSLRIVDKLRPGTLECTLSGSQEVLFFHVLRKDGLSIHEVVSKAWSIVIIVVGQELSVERNGAG